MSGMFDNLTPEEFNAIMDLEETDPAKYRRRVEILAAKFDAGRGFATKEQRAAQDAILAYHGDPGIVG